MLCGFNVSCVGDNGNFSIIESPSEKLLLIFLKKEVIKNKRKFKNIVLMREEVMKDNIVHQVLNYLFVDFQDQNMENIVNIILV